MAVLLPSIKKSKLKVLKKKSGSREQRVLNDMIASLGLYNVCIKNLSWQDFDLAMLKPITLNHQSFLVKEQT